MRAKVLKVRLTPLAQADLEDIWTYSYETWSLEQAEIYIRLLTSAFSHLASGKNVGVQSSAGIDYLRHVVGSHVVFYRETAETLDIVRVLHQRMDVDRHL